VPFLDLARCGPLEFSEPAWEEFPCLALAYRALEAERSLPIVLNAANEVAVAAFLQGKVGFTAIPRVIADAMDAHRPTPVETVAAIRRVDSWARGHAAAAVAEIRGAAAPSKMDVKG
jgi:1-deoxy-D-xylulose-5-phosphate reductoisomerase